MLLDCEDVAATLVEQLEGAAATAGNTGEGIVSDDHGQAGLLHQQAIQVAQQRAATGQDDTALGNICTEFRWRLLERRLDCADDAGKRFLQGFEDFVAVQGEGARDAL